MVVWCGTPSHACGQSPDASAKDRSTLQRLRAVTDA
jgi:hypothetical protein